MPAHRTPYPPLELDLDEISTVRQAPQPASGPTPTHGSGEPIPSDPGDAAATSDRLTAAPTFDLEAFARDVMSDAPDAPAPPESDVRPVADPVADPPLVTRPPTALVEEMNRYLREEDFSAALVIADEILEGDPAHKAAKQGSLRCQAALELGYMQRLGPLSQVPSVTVPPKEIPNLALDHRSGFILALVDGVSTLDMILDMSSGMRRLDVLRVLFELVQQGILDLA